MDVKFLKYIEWQIIATIIGAVFLWLFFRKIVDK